MAEWQQSCKQSLPHEQFNNKIKEPHITRDLQMENMYCIDMLPIKPEFWTGGYRFVDPPDHPYLWEQVTGIPLFGKPHLLLMILPLRI
jgi:hypothetical protein